MASGVVSFMGVTETLNAYPTYIIAYLSLIHCLSPVKQYRETKNITPRTDQCGVKGKLNAEQLLILAELIEASDDATLEELRYLLYGRIGFSVSRATIGRMIKLLDITAFKKLSSLQEKAQSDFKSCDVSSGKQLNRLV